MLKDFIIIAVDGPAGSGKSSVSKEVARRLDISYIDSGAIYRAITWYILRTFGIVEPEKNYIEGLSGISITQDFNKDGVSKTFVNGEDVSEEIRDELIAKNIGVISDNPNIRNFVNHLLRGWAMTRSIIMDGRDIGTVVFPGSDYKIFLDASVEVRSLRRFKEYIEMGKTVDVNEIKKQIIRRDEEDSRRPFGRLIKADDAYIIDTSSLTKEEVINLIIKKVSGI
jgi:CMP/dCMP kinase